MELVEPVADAAGAIAHLEDDRALVIADYHAGFEAALRYEGVEVKSRAKARRNRLMDLLERTDPDRLVVLGDLAHWIGEPAARERDELDALLDALADTVSMTLIKGNHDGAIDETLDIETTDTRGVRIGDVGFTHGHTWPSRAVLEADVVCIGHEHPTVRLSDEVGGRRIERAWLRGNLAADAFGDYGAPEDIGGELIVMPAFNELVGGTWINVEGQSFLSPFLPDALADGEAYLLDGTRLGEYRRVS